LRSESQKQKIEQKGTLNWGNSQQDARSKQELEARNERQKQ
jgi:hypothetical protein